MTQSEQKRRTTHRFNFYAPAELISVHARELTAVTSLSLYGCYLESTSPQPLGTLATVKIFCGGQSFEATAAVLYVLGNRGMGLRFSEVKPQFLYMLGEWLGKALRPDFQTLAGAPRPPAQTRMGPPKRIYGIPARAKTKSPCVRVS